MFGILWLSVVYCDFEVLLLFFVLNVSDLYFSVCVKAVLCSRRWQGKNCWLRFGKNVCTINIGYALLIDIEVLLAIFVPALGSVFHGVDVIWLKLCAVEHFRFFINALNLITYCPYIYYVCAKVNFFTPSYILWTPPHAYVQISFPTPLKNLLTKVGY